MWIIGLLLFENWPSLFSGTLEKVWNLILKIMLLTFPSFIIVLSECIINLIASTIVNIQIHRFKDSSHTRSSSMFSLIMMLIASKRDAFLLIEQTELLIDIQSYAVLFLRISVIRFFKVCYFFSKINTACLAVNVYSMSMNWYQRVFEIIMCNIKLVYR